MKDSEDRSPFAAALTFFLDGWGKGSALSRTTKISSGYISELASGKKEGKEDVRRAIADYFKLPYESFLRLGQLILDGAPGEEALELAKVGDKPFPAILSVIDDQEFVSVPKAQAKLSAGGGYFAEEGFSGEYHFRSDWLNSICNPKDAVLFDCQGDSMSPFISDGETVLVDRGDTEFQDDKVFAIGVGDTVLVKRLRLNIDNRIKVISDNRDKGRYPTEVVSPDEIRILGRVKWRAGEV